MLQFNAGHAAEGMEFVDGLSREIPSKNLHSAPVLLGGDKYNIDRRWISERLTSRL
jgi:hypothetical protein